MSDGLLLPAAPRDEVRAFFEPRAAAVDRCEASVREGLAFLHAGVLTADPEALEWTARTIATVAWSDLASAFSLWAHRMVLIYLGASARDGPPDPRWQERLERAELLGSTALAGPMAYHLGQTPLALEARWNGDALVLDGRIRWASNLFAPEFVLVSAARCDGELAVFAAEGNAPGLSVDPCPELVAMQATGSSSLQLTGVRVGPEAVLSRRFDDFVRRVRPAFLILQSSFCWGLAWRSLEEARTALRGTALVFRPDVEARESEAASIAAGLADAARSLDLPMHALVRLRLDAAQLAVAATALEAKILGSASFLRDGATSRRLREAAFLPIQTPTEAQLRTELARAAEMVS